MLTKAQILGAIDLPSETVNVPEWGGAIVVRTMTGTERDTFEQDLADDKDNPIFRARMLVRCLTDENGAPLFTDDDVDALSAKSCKALERVYNVARRLNGIGNDQAEALRGNSSATPAEDLPSA